MSLAALEDAASIYARAIETRDHAKIEDAVELLLTTAISHHKEIEGLMPRLKKFNQVNENEPCEHMRDGNSI